MGITIRRRKGIETRVVIDEGVVVRIFKSPTKIKVGDKLHEIFYDDDNTQKPRLFIHRQFINCKRHR